MQQESTSTALTLSRVDVEGGSLYRAPDGSALIRDSDIAHLAGLARSRDSKRTIQRLIDSGAVVVVDGAHTCARSDDGRPVVVRTVEHVRCGRGRMQATAVFYADETAAMFVLMKLRTAQATEGQRRVAHAFLALRRSSTALAAPPPAAPPPALDLGAMISAAIRDVIPSIVEATVRATLGAMPQAAPQLAPAAPPPAPTAIAAPPAAEEPPVAPAAPKPAEPPTLPIRPLPETREWLSATRCAARLSFQLQRQISACAVGLALTGLGLRDSPELFRIEIVERAHGAEGEASSARWSPAAYRILLEHFAQVLAAPKPGPKKARRTQRIHDGAQQVLEALAADGPGAAPISIPRPTTRPN